MHCSSDQIKVKLLRDNDLCLQSPDSDGLTLNVAICDTSKGPPSNVIAAVRLLFGATSVESIPKYVTVQGSRTKIIQGAKRWYACRLTTQDMLLGIRSGVISIHVSRCADGTTKPIIDAFDTYAIERSVVERWIPTSLQEIVATTEHATVRTCKGLREPARFHRLSRAMESLNRVLGPRKPSEKQTVLLKDLVRETVLDYDRPLAEAVRSLVYSFENSIDDQDAFLDGATISGCAEFLSRCGQALDTSLANGSEDEYNQCWHRVRPSFRACVRVAAGIARVRPSNYLKAIGEQSAIAVRASLLMNQSVVQSPLNGDAVSDFVELALLESAVARGYGADYDTRGRFASFSILHQLLTSQNQIIVQRSCEAISIFCWKYSLSERLGSGEVDLFAAKPMVVHYGCDGCSRFPIPDVRYCLNDEDRPLDLCNDCFKVAQGYAADKGFDDGENVQIQGKTLGEGAPLTCADVEDMEALPIRKPATNYSGDTSSAVGQDGTSHQQTSETELNEAEVFQRQQLFDEFMDGLFAMILNLLSSELEKQELFVCTLISLISELSRYSDPNDQKTDRVARVARKLVEVLTRLLQKYRCILEDELSSRKLRICLVRFLRALSSLVVPDDRAREYLINPKDGGIQFADKAPDSSGMKGPICCHGEAARRTYLDGKCKGRSFYCCATKSKAHRCNFFVWSDEVATGCRSLFNERNATLVWSLLSHPQPRDSVPLSVSLCNLVEESITRVGRSSIQQMEPEGSQLFSQEGSLRRALRDFSDGVWCSKERRYGTLLALSSSRRQMLQSSAHVDSDVLDASLELMALVAGTEGEGNSKWFAPICHLLFSEVDDVNSHRPKAKRALWQLCGKAHARFLAVRDRYSFKLHFAALVEQTRDLLNYCLVVNQKAEQRSRHRRSEATRPRGYEDLRLGDVVGAVDLINEDVGLKHNVVIVEKSLNELLSIATKRRENWRKFCFSASEEHSNSETEAALPIDELLAVSCILSNELQIDAMKLLSLAVPPRAFKPQGYDPFPNKESHENKLGDLEELQASNASPDDLFAFVDRFVCGGESQEIRRFSVKIVIGLCEKSDVAGQLLGRLSRMPLASVGDRGKMAFDFLVLMNELACCVQPTSVDAAALGSTVSRTFQRQAIAVSFERTNGQSFHFETRSNSSTQKNRFELTRCAHVVLRHPALSPTSTRPATIRVMQRLPEQVSPLVRMHLDIGRNSSSSNEFNSFVALPHRCVVSEIHVDIDPRGRFVKKVNFYSTPRPVDTPARLKSDEYNNRWQLCGVLELPKGSEKATCTLSRKVVASNIRIEYSEFYDRPGSSGSQTEGFVVHCPRCTRVVTNAHGVCGSCGEVAFQCRRCRHINYDRLDAFLCVECGFCASGSFSYDITAGVASNAVAITNDQDYRQAERMFATASWLFEETRKALREKLMKVTSGTGKKDFGPGSSSLKRAFEGKLPFQPDKKEDTKDSAQSVLDRFSKRGSIVKFVARKRRDQVTSRRSSSVRQNRSEDNEDDEELASDLLGGLLENAGLSRSGLDPSDPVSRFLASVQSRSRERRSGNRDSSQQSSSSDKQKQDPQTTNSAGSKDKTLEECERLYRLMHEAQRECFALERRIDAWRRLESGSLSPTSPNEESSEAAEFEPCHCSICAGVVMHQLLILWQSLFRLDPARVVVSKDMLAMLLSHSSNDSKGLQDTKLATVRDIALNSENVVPWCLRLCACA